jgi:hypothetical protein
MRKKIHLIAFLSIISLRVFSQGCSDAGFCSLGALKNINTFDQPKHQLDLGFNFGYGEQKTLTYNPYLQYGVTLSDRISLQGKLTTTYASGFLGSSFNVGDIYGVITYAATKNQANVIHIIGGIKVPLTTANDKGSAGLPLPLDYQSSLGTYDFIGGINYVLSKHLEADAALQIPFIQNNHNTFFEDEYTDNRIKYFASTNNFKRKPDLLFRLGYYINLPYAISLKPNFLVIYRLSPDSYESRSGIRSSIMGTQGLTLNEGVSITKQFKDHNQLEIIIAQPLISKRVDDGLIREWILNIQYSIAF